MSNWLLSSLWIETNQPWQNYNTEQHTGTVLHTCMTPIGRLSVFSHSVRQQHTWIFTRAPPMLACKYVDETAWLIYWPPRCQQVSHRRWILGICWTRVTKHTSQGIHPDLETQDRCHQKSKTGVSMAKQNGQNPDHFAKRD